MCYTRSWKVLLVTNLGALQEQVRKCLESLDLIIAYLKQ